MKRQVLSFLEAGDFEEKHTAKVRMIRVFGSQATMQNQEFGNGGAESGMRLKKTQSMEEWQLVDRSEKTPEEEPRAAAAKTSRKYLLDSGASHRVEWLHDGVNKELLEKVRLQLAVGNLVG